MDDHSLNVYNHLMRLCPDMLKPFAEMMLPSALEQMDQAQKLDLESQLESHKDKSEQDNAIMLISFAKVLGADASMFEMAQTMGLEVDDGLKALLG